jgi:hypothetical protein
MTKQKKAVEHNPTYDNYVDYIIVCLTSGIFMPPRRSLDWCAMKVKDVDKSTDNYINGSYFVCNQFKTKKFVSDEDKKVLIPSELKKVINKWKKINNNEYLIFQKNGNPYTSSTFTKALNRIYGVGVSTDMLRSMYLTNKFGETAKQLEQMNKITKAIGSSTGSALQYYIKSDQK